MRSALLTCVLVLAPATVASADVSFNGYDHKNNNTCAGTGSRQDPVTVLFAVGATYSTFSSPVGNSIAVHVGWGSSSPNDNPFGSSSHLYTHSCKPPSGVNQSGPALSNRWHVRHYKNDDHDATWGYVAYGTPHFDTLCGVTGHAASAFTTGRAHIVNGYTANGHANHGTFWKGNTGVVQQCNGTYAGADGYVTRVHQHYALH